MNAEYIPQEPLPEGRKGKITSFDDYGMLRAPDPRYAHQVKSFIGGVFRFWPFPKSDELNRNLVRGNLVTTYNDHEVFLRNATDVHHNLSARFGIFTEKAAKPEDERIERAHSFDPFHFDLATEDGLQVDTLNPLAVLAVMGKILNFVPGQEVSPAQDYNRDPVIEAHLDLLGSFLVDVSANRN